MNRTLRASLGLALAALGACATTSLPVSTLKPVPPERVTWQPEAAPTAGQLLLARDSGFTGSLARVIVTVDGTRAGEVMAKEVLRLRVSPGRRVVTVSVQGVGGELHRPRSIEVDVRPEATTLLRVGFDDGLRGFSVWQDVLK